MASTGRASDNAALLVLPARAALRPSMRYQTKLLITAGLLLAMSLSAAALTYLGVAQSHSYLLRSRIAHQELERQLQLSRHSQQLFKAWTDTLLTGITDRPLGAAYLHKVIESDLSELEQLTKRSEERRVGKECKYRSEPSHKTKESTKIFT